MKAMEQGCMYKNSNVPEAGERVAAYVEDYLAKHRGLTLGELAFSLKADKRDLQRLVRDRSCGWRLAEGLAAYFGRDFVEALFGPIVGDGPSIREKELERERAEIAARRERLERSRQEVRGFRFDPPSQLRVASDEDR
jgi:hypothetical protein